MPHPFDRSGLAALSDFKTEEWRQLFVDQERKQLAFLAHERSFRSPEYVWPRDPLHQWSRCWEYPYAFHHARQRRGTLIDLGSGVTYFPFACAELGYHVLCCDIDPVCAVDIPRAAAATQRDVSFRLSDGPRLPFADGEADVLCCISVLEHIPGAHQLVAEIARVLKPRGLFILTCDLDLLGNAEIGPEHHRQLLDALSAHFEWRVPERAVHPADMLTNISGPYPMQRPEGLRRAFFYAKQLVKPLLGRKPMWFAGGLHLAVHGMVLEKR